MTSETYDKLGAYHDSLILLLDKVKGNKNRHRILRKIAYIEIILINNHPNEKLLKEEDYFNE